MNWSLSWFCWLCRLSNQLFKCLKFLLNFCSWLLTRCLWLTHVLNSFLLFKGIEKTLNTIIALILRTVTLILFCHDLRFKILWRARFNILWRARWSNSLLTLWSASISLVILFWVFVDLDWLTVRWASSIGHSSHSWRLCIWVIDWRVFAGRWFFWITIKSRAAIVQEWILCQSSICFSIGIPVLIQTFLACIALSTSNADWFLWFFVIRRTISKGPSCIHGSCFLLSYHFFKLSLQSSYF